MSKQTALQHRRAARIAAERTEAARERRGRRLRLLVAAGAAAAILAVAAAVVSSGGGEDAPASPVRTSALFAGIPEHGGVLGDPRAPLTVTEYVDLQCPVCARAASTTLPTLVRDFVRTGKVKLRARVLQFLGPDSVRAARVAAGAERQGRLWPVLETFFADQGAENSGYVTDGFLRSVAHAAGVNADAALAQVGSAAAGVRLNDANAAATRVGVSGTPTFTVQRGTGAERKLNADALDPASVATALEREARR